MDVKDAAYRGMSVTGFRPNAAPNPQCCSSRCNLCPECARLALQDYNNPTNNYNPFTDSSGHGHYCSKESENAMCMNKDNRDDEPLRLPVINWAQEPESTPTDGCFHPGDLVVDLPGIAQHELSANSTTDDDEPLQLPVVNWAE